MKTRLQTDGHQRGQPERDRHRERDQRKEHLSRFAVNLNTMPICFMRPMKPTFSGCCALAMQKV